MSDIVCIGDTVIDLYMQVEDNAATTHDGQICFLHGSKVPINKLSTYIGGNAYNSCIGLNKLGINTALCTTIGIDEYTGKFLEDFKKNKLDMEFVDKDKAYPNNVHAVISFNNERTIFSHHENRKYSFPQLNKTKFIYYTSLGYGYQNFQDKLITHIKEHPDIVLAYSPGSIQLKNIEKVKEILKYTAIVVMNKEEAHIVTGLQKESLETLHKALHKNGAKLSVITSGKDGSSGYDGTNLIKVGTYGSNNVVDKTGAGDAYTSAFIAGIFYKKTLKDCLTWGMINSGHKIQFIGATNGLCSVKEIESIQNTL